MIAVDTTILIYAHRSDAAEHRAAKDALERLAEQHSQWAIPWPCIHEFLAVSTGRAFGEAATPLEDALMAVGVWLNHPRCKALHETDRHLSNLAGLCERARLTGGAVHDARIAAICIDNGVKEFWTCDRDFTRFPDLNSRNPLIPSLREPAPPHYAVRSEM